MVRVNPSVSCQGEASKMNVPLFTVVNVTVMVDKWESNAHTISVKLAAHLAPYLVSGLFTDKPKMAEDESQGRKS